MFARHGDLSFHPITAVPKGYKEVYEGNQFVLALGEHTGHKHVLLADLKEKFKVAKNKEGGVCIVVTRPAKIRHEEHKEITLKPGTYLMKNEREYDYFLESIRRVED